MNEPGVQLCVVAAGVRGAVQNNSHVAHAL